MKPESLTHSEWNLILSSTRLSDAVPDVHGQMLKLTLVCSLHILPLPFPTLSSNENCDKNAHVCLEPAAPSEEFGAWGKELRLCTEFTSLCCPYRAWQVIYLCLTILVCSTWNGKNNNTWPARIRRKHMWKSTYKTVKWGTFVVLLKEVMTK